MRLEAEHGLTCECGQTFQNPKELTKHINLQSLELQSDYEPRQPNQTELEQVAQWYVNNHGLGFEEAVGTVNQGYYVVIDSYVTGGPGFAGKVLIEIGSNGPGFHTVYTWNDGKIQRRDQSDELQDKDER